MEFIKGMDISSLIEEEKCGAKYFMDGVQMDLLKILKTKGCNYCRLRLWNNPYDEAGTPYGAGSNDMSRLIELSKRVKAEAIKESETKWLTWRQHSPVWPLISIVP